MESQTIERFRFASEYRATVDGDKRHITGRFTPYGVPDGRPGYMLRLADGGERLEIVEYEGSIFEPGVFDAWLESNSDRVSFLFQHGDAGEGWSGNPQGINALPLGKLDTIENRDDGAYFTATFASHPLAEAVRELAEMGALTELSFAMRPVTVEVRKDARGTFRYVSGAELWDVSAVVNGQFGEHAKITEVFSALKFRNDPALVVPVMSAGTVIYAGASISKANAEVLNAAVTDLRSAIDTLAKHADAIEALVASGARSSDEESSTDDNEGDSDAEARTRLHLAALDAAELELSQ